MNAGNKTIMFYQMRTRSLTRGSDREPYFEGSLNEIIYRPLNLGSPSLAIFPLIAIQTKFEMSKAAEVPATFSCLSLCETLVISKHPKLISRWNIGDLVLVAEIS